MDESFCLGERTRKEDPFSPGMGMDREVWVGGWRYKQCSTKEHSIVSTVPRNHRGDAISGPASALGVPAEACHAPSSACLPPLPVPTRTAKELRESACPGVREGLQVRACQQGLGSRGQALGG